MTGTRVSLQGHHSVASQLLCSRAAPPDDALGREMILTHCAACAVPLPRPAKQCSRCKTLYCGPACQKQHWEAGTHDMLCKKIKKQGGAEQYHANKKCSEAIAVAVEACAADTKGQTCYICLEAVHPRTGEGLVRGCACGDRDGVASGKTGIAHVSCLAEQAKVLVAEAEEKNLRGDAFHERLDRWHTCSLCEQEYYGVVRCALGWACWKTYLGRPETNGTRLNAMTQLGNGLFDAEKNGEALVVREAELSLLRRTGRDETDPNVLVMQGNIAQCYKHLGQIEKSFAIEQRVYRMQRAILGDDHENTRISAMNIARTLAEGLNRHKEAARFLRKEMPPLMRNISRDHANAIKLQLYLANCLSTGNDASWADLREAAAILEDLNPRARRVFGPQHPETLAGEFALSYARRKLAAVDTASA